jgi:hypothetical protein
VFIADPAGGDDQREPDDQRDDNQRPERMCGVHIALPPSALRRPKHNSPKLMAAIHGLTAPTSLLIGAPRKLNRRDEANGWRAVRGQTFTR